MAHKVEFRPGAIQDLERIHAYVFDSAGPRAAMCFVQRVIEQCLALADMPERSPLRPQVGPNVRLLIWKRSVCGYFRAVSCSPTIRARIEAHPLTFAR